jgi:hypothetical protein
MTNKQYRVYIWIVTLLIEHPGITMDEIQKRWQKERQLSEGKLLHRRSFIRYCHEVKQVWGIEIVCNRHTDYCYFIRNEEILNGDDIRNWMLTTLCVGMQVEDCLELNNRIVMEYVPSGQKWLLPLCRAMKENSRVEVTYKGYGCGKSWQATMSPYCVRLTDKTKKKWLSQKCTLSEFRSAGGFPTIDGSSSGSNTGGGNSGGPSTEG